MILQTLNGQWQMHALPEGELLACTIPGSVASALLDHGKLPDPYWRDNEEKIQSVFRQDFQFERSFEVKAEELLHDYIFLCCEGLDTIADVRLNGKIAGHAENMHRTWRFDVKDSLQEGENHISVLFHSPVRFLEEHTTPIGKPYSALRKAACMFGWDWGLNLPDSGIWRNIYLESFDMGRIASVRFSQRHEKGKVRLSVNADCEVWGTEPMALSVTLNSPDKELLLKKEVTCTEGVEFFIENPALWWPVGYGEQPLYEVEIDLVCERASAMKDKVMTTLSDKDMICDHVVKRIGLRTITLDRSDTEDGDGTRYSLVVNGIPVFFRGENMIIEDSVISRTDRRRWERLIQNCLLSNLNGIRVWGGAYYPSEEFYELCDEKGLLVYQDFMFACSFYAVSSDFLANVEEELKDNLSRIAHHACIAVYCGNNEIDGIYTVTGSADPETVELRILFGSGKDPLSVPVRQMLWAQYQPLFLELIPQMCRKYAPDTDYVHSSPSLKEAGSASSFFDYLSGGDMHYYLQYNGNAPYQKMRSMRCRFMTEMGFQSYPSMKSIRSFTLEEDRFPYTSVMYAHQKCANGNEAIELYMERDYRVPGNFADYVYLSQLQAGEIMRFSVEHFRRDNGYCRGVILWQLNDCWPVVSWSGIDYYGRWKALQYYIKRFYAPVLLSVKDDGLRDEIWLSNEAPKDCSGILSWELWGADGTVEVQDKKQVTVLPGESRAFFRLDFTELVGRKKKNSSYLHYAFEGDFHAEGVVLFVSPKEYQFVQPEIDLEITEEDEFYAIRIESSCMVKAVELDTREGDCIYSDNYFDLCPGKSRVVTVQKELCKEIRNAGELRDLLTVRSLNEVMRRATENECRLGCNP